MKLRSKGTRAGFTLIELSFAIAFISVLLITITLITNEIVSIYRKGYSIKTVNQVGRDIIDDFQNSIMQSPPASISAFCARAFTDDETIERCEESNSGFYSVYQQYYTGAKVKDSEDDSTHYLPAGGIFCSGKNTYIWNTGYLFNNELVYDLNGDDQYTSADIDTAKDLRIKLNYSVNGADPDHAKFASGNFRLLKIEDSSRSICAAALKSVGSGNENYYPSSTEILSPPATEINFTETLATAPEEMLKDTDASLALYDFVLFEPARVTTTGRLLFSGSFILGTVNGGVDIMTSSNYCKAPSNFSADFSYCAINKFNFSIQASGNK